MEPVMWVEILSRHHEVTARHRCSGETIRVGRGYGNDVVLDDPFVAPEHLRLSRSAEGGWLAEDLGTANGLHTERGKARLDRIALDGHQIIRIGRTLLRIRPAAYPVAAEKVATRQRPLWPAALLLAAGIIGIEIGSDWLAETGEPRLQVYLTGLLQIGLQVLGWVGGWTILCRVFTGHAKFERHLVIALAGIFSFSALDEVLKLAGFALSWQVLLAYEYVAMWIILATVSFGHLQQITPQRWRLTGSIVAILALLAGTVQTVGLSEAHRNSDPPPPSGRLYPPALRLVAPQTDGQFFDDVAKLRDKLEEDRKDEDQ
jgi:Inner membrane component of T3SS, cytoplasmic domain